MRWRRSSPSTTGEPLPDLRSPADDAVGSVDALVGAEQATQRLERAVPIDPDRASTEVLSRLGGSAGVPPAGASAAPQPVPAEASAAHHTNVLEPDVAGAAADPFRDTTMLDRAPTEDHPPAVAPLLTRQRAAEVGMYCGAALVMVSVVGIAALQWDQWDKTERLITTTLAAVALVLGGAWLRAPWGRPASEEGERGVSVMLTTGVLAGGIGSALLLDLGQSSDLLAGFTHASVTVGAMLLVNAVARSAFSETALLGALAWLGWIALPAGLALWAGLGALGVAWVALGVRFARGRRTAAVAGAGLTLTAAAALAAQPGAWVARAVLLIVAAGSLWAFRGGRENYWLALGAAAACALAAGTATDALSPAPALLVGGMATMLVSGAAMRGARREAGEAVGAPSN